jgi:putative SOS response-associated peptidase YedK
VAGLDAGRGLEHLDLFGQLGTTQPRFIVWLIARAGQPIHDRMPVMLALKDHEKWLGDDPAARSAVLRPYPAAEMVAYSVSTHVNRPENDTSRCIEPIQECPEPRVGRMLFE